MDCKEVKRWLQWFMLQLPSEQDAKGITVEIPRLDQYAAAANPVKHCMHSRGLTEQHKLILPPLKHNPNIASSVKLYCSWVGLFPQFLRKFHWQKIQNFSSLFFSCTKNDLYPIFVKNGQVPSTLNLRKPSWKSEWERSQCYVLIVILGQSRSQKSKTIHILNVKIWNNC